MSHIERTSGDGRAGTTYHNTSRFLGRETELVYTVTEVDPGRRIALQGENSSITTHDTITVEPADGGGTTVTYRADFDLHGLAKLADPFMALPLKKLGDDAEKALTQALDRL
ncbi:MAG: SRPBCC family protein [Nocardioidaceae bacterium]